MSAVEPLCDILIRVRGTVQGVGFRPFVHRLATRLGLAGWVRNDPQGVLIRVVGTQDRIDALERALREELPPAAYILALVEQPLDPALPEATTKFSIIESGLGGSVEASIPVDLAICTACRNELTDMTNRRYRFPFINCTQCGPRYSIVKALPYDRPKTTMRAFRMCSACQSEYDDPSSRRFHAQPNACPCCGPQAFLTGRSGAEVARGDAAIQEAARRIAHGQIVAVKGLGGYHLMVDATNEAAVAELRHRKHRDEKPFAVMFESLARVKGMAEVSDDAARLLTSSAAPIVLLPRRTDAALARGVAPGNPWVGAMIASTPLHLLLLAGVDRPVVATSANLAEEPLCADNAEAHDRLKAIADVFLDHDRPIAHPVDDSVVRMARTGRIVLRRARGYAPSPLLLPAAIDGNWLCAGAHMKNTAAVAAGDRVVLSPHIGDLAGAATMEVFQRTVEVLRALHARDFSAVACDKHPDYASSRFAATLGLPCRPVQHHLAHVLACLMEHGRAPENVLGVSWDGTGWGEDATVWGGEFILLRNREAVRFGRLGQFRLPGGDVAAREPRRVALSLLQTAGNPRCDAIARTLGFTHAELGVFKTMIERGLNAPLASSVGRLFDGVGALLGLGRSNRFEGQTPLALEAAAVTGATLPAPTLPLAVRDLPPESGAYCELDWHALLDALLLQQERDATPGTLALAFHRALAGGIVAMARRAGVGTVALSGGCFQNALLLDLTVEALRAERFEVLTHRELPPNDGNIAAGQALGALWNLTSVMLP